MTDERAAVDAYLRAPDEPNGFKPCPLCGSTIPDEPNELDDLRVEVERLRGEVDAERAAVVAWLRAEAVAFAGTRTEQGVQRAKSLALAADNIERGEHRREEKP
jgi:hypothetical protein